MYSNRWEIGRWGIHLSVGYRSRWLGFMCMVQITEDEVCISGDIGWFGYYIGWVKPDVFEEIFEGSK